MNRRLHPLSYFILCVFYSSLALTLQHPHMVALVFFLAWLVDFRMGSRYLIKRLNSLEKLFWLIISLVLIQLIFRRGGGIAYSLGPIHLHREALNSAALLTFRIMSVYMCALSLSRMDFSLYRSAFAAISLPEELSFMVSYMAHLIPGYGARFKEQMQELKDRGISIRSLKFREKIELYKILALSAIADIILSSGRKAIALELRGFRSKGRPVYLHRHRFGGWDLANLLWMLCVLAIIYILMSTWYRNCTLCVTI
jgi:energy-coupling factor transporter transmembrane protein EcfT